MIDLQFQNRYTHIRREPSKYGNYIWNKTFYKKINKGICPECDTPNIIHKGNIIGCSHCNFELQGSPETIAYFDNTTPEKLPELHDQICPEPSCDGIKFQHDFKRDETICLKCGLVVSGPPAYSSYIKIDYPFNYTFECEVIWIKKNGERVVGYYYPPEYYRDPTQLTSYKI